MEEKKTSFLDSTTDGMWGFVKGALTGGAIGAIGGAAVAAVVALIAPDMIGSLLASGSVATGEVGAAAVAGATAVSLGAGPVATASVIGGSVGGAILSTVGGFSGMATEVIRGREAAQVSGEDVANVAKISYAQGVMVGHNIAQEQQAEVSTKFRDKVAQQRTQAQQAQKTH
ncbi:MAG: hypothetical protein ACK502_01645 [Alphaproteobacteria bacterium]